MRIFDIPKKYKVDAYHAAIDAQVKALAKVEGVKSIYQIGGLSTPGISDIDLVVVFEDGFKYDFNPRSYNSDVANYLFTHGLYGASEKHFRDCLKFTFFHNFRLLYGEDYNLENSTDPKDQQTLKKQIALEFLFKMYINLAVQRSYNSIKLRSMFLHIKALPYDFDFLNINPLEVLDLVYEGIGIRNTWFSGSVSKKDVENWFRTFFKIYEIFLIDLFNEHRLNAAFLDFKIAPNISINNAEQFGYMKKGFVFPDPLNILDKKYFKVLNKFNDFCFYIPLEVEVPKIVKAYFNYADEVAYYNNEHIPFFMTLTSSLKVYK